MSSEIKIKMPVNFDKINANDLCELIWWSAHLGVGPEKLFLPSNVLPSDSVGQDVAYYGAIIIFKRAPLSWLH